MKEYVSDTMKTKTTLSHKKTAQASVMETVIRQMKS